MLFFLEIFQSIPTRTAGVEHMSGLLNHFLEETDKILRDNCVDICTDGTKAMIGIINGSLQRTKKKKICETRSSGHRHMEAIAVIKLSTNCMNAHDEIIKTINVEQFDS